MNSPETPADTIRASLDALERAGIKIGPWNEVERWGSNSVDMIAVLLDGTDQQLRVTYNSAHNVAHRLLGDDDLTDDEVCADTSAIEPLLLDVITSVASVLDRSGVDGVASSLGWAVIDITASPADGFKRSVVAGAWAETRDFRDALTEMLNDRGPAHSGAPIDSDVASILAGHARDTVTSITVRPELIADRLPIKIAHPNPVWTARLARAFNDLAVTFEAGECPAAPTSLGDRIALRVVVEAASSDLTTSLSQSNNQQAQCAADAVEHLLNLAGNPYQEAAATALGNWFLA